MSINERLNPPLWIAKNGITPLPTVYGWANSETGEMLCRVKDIPDPDLSYIFNAKQRKILESAGLLIPTGAIESVDGEYQRFVYDGSNLIQGYYDEPSPIWYAGLLEQTRQHQYQITLKIPELLDEQYVHLQIVDAEIADIFNLGTRNRLTFSVAHSFNFAAVRLGLAGGNTTQATLSPSPASGSTVVLTLTPTTLDYVWDGGSGSLVIPAGFFANAPNVLAYSLADTDPTLIAPLSIKVAEVDALV